MLDSTRTPKMAANIGTLLGNLVGALLRTVLTDEQLVAWGWRIPFLSGILIAFVAVYLRFCGEEHHPNAGEYDAANEEGRDGNGEPVQVKHPLREAIREENLPALCSATLTPMLYGAGFYTSFVWMAIFMETLIDPPIENAFWVNAMSLFFGVVLILPLAGMLSDHFGRTRTMLVGALGLGIAGPFMLIIISLGDAVDAFFAQWTIGLFLSLFGGPMNAWLVEKFPPKVRLTSAALGYDLAHCTASAFSPLIATLLVQNVGPKAPGIIIYPFYAVVAMIGMGFATKIHHDGGLDDNVDSTDDDEQTDLNGDYACPPLI